MEGNTREGSRIELVHRQAYPRTRRSDRAYSLGVFDASESPLEAFELLFPRYQIEQYRGVKLRSINKLPFLHQRWSGLSIRSEKNIGGPIGSLYKTNIKPALRHPNTRCPGYLGREADFILNRALPDIKDFLRYREEDIENWKLAVEELSLAFSHLREKGIICQ